MYACSKFPKAPREKNRASKQERERGDYGDIIVMIMMKREAFPNTKAKSTVQSVKEQMNDNAELTESAHSVGPITN